MLILFSRYFEWSSRSTKLNRALSLDRWTFLTLQSYLIQRFLRRIVEAQQDIFLSYLSPGIQRGVKKLCSSVKVHGRTGHYLRNRRARLRKRWVGKRARQRKWRRLSLTSLNDTLWKDERSELVHFLDFSLLHCSKIPFKMFYRYRIIFVRWRIISMLCIR